MNRNTITAAGSLRLGDRFYKAGDSKKRTFEVIEKYNEAIKCVEPHLSAEQRDIWQLQKRFRASTEVVFLRHTRPEPGEDCLIDDLRPGDIFHLFGDIITEFECTEKKDGKKIVCFSYPFFEKAIEPGTTVILIKKAA
jgi:hypothetical protein